MNRYFDKTDRFNSNSRIFEAYYTEAAQGIKQTYNTRRSLLSHLSEKLASKKIARALRIVKPIVFTSGLLSILCVAGAVESGSLGIGAGCLLSLLILGIEYLVLRIQRA